MTEIGRRRGPPEPHENLNGSAEVPVLAEEENKVCRRGGDTAETCIGVLCVTAPSSTHVRMAAIHTHRHTHTHVRRRSTSSCKPRTPRAPGVCLHAARTCCGCNARASASFA